MAALVALHLFFGVDIQTDSEYAAAKTAIVQQYVSAGKTETAAEKEVADLDACFGSYEVPPENTNHPAAMIDPHPAHHRTAKEQTSRR